MNDLNYFPLDVESNIYGMTTLEFDDKTSKVLVATSDCQIYCISYFKFKPQTREVEFTYIPNGARIISIGSLKRGPNDFVIGITHSLSPSIQKGSTRSNSNFSGREGGDYGRLTTYYFNIYASGSVSSSFDLDYVAQGCQTIRLRYVPYHLYQTELISIADASSMSIKSKPFWLLSGGDNCIHAFCEDRPYQSFNEIPIEDCFPELKNLSSLALWMDVANVDQGFGTYERVIAIGFEDGSVTLFQSTLTRSLGKFQMVKKSSFDHYTTIIPSVRIFKVHSASPSKLRDALKSRDIINENIDQRLKQLNLLVVSSTEHSIVFEDILNFGLDKKFELPNSQRLDCAVTSAVGDTNLDGLNELIIGTHGRELITYHYDTRSYSYSYSKVSELNHPVYAISILDLTGDALKDVTVLLASGILVMQVAIKDVIKTCRRRIETILSTIT